MGKFLAQIVPTILIGSRWLMAPLYLGLIAALVVLIVEFFHELAAIVMQLGTLETAAFILAVLKLVDLVLLGNLLLIILFAGILTLGASIVARNTRTGRGSWAMSISPG